MKTRHGTGLASTDNPEVRAVQDHITRRGRPLEKQRKRGLPCAETDVLDLDTNDVRGILNFNASAEVHRTSIIEREGRDQEIRR